MTSNNIKAVVGGPLGPEITVKVWSNGAITPTNPVILGPTSYNNTIVDIDNRIANAAATAYANSITYDVNIGDVIHDFGEF